MASLSSNRASLVSSRDGHPEIQAQDARKETLQPRSSMHPVRTGCRNAGWDRRADRSSKPSSCCPGPSRSWRRKAHNMWITASRRAVLSIITGGGKWVDQNLPGSAVSTSPPDCRKEVLAPRPERRATRPVQHRDARARGCKRSGSLICPRPINGRSWRLPI